MSRYEYNASLVNSGIQALNDSITKLNNTSTDLEKGFDMIKNARGAEYLTIDSTEIVQAPKNSQDLITSMISEITTKAQTIEEYNNTSFMTKLSASIGMGITKLGEGIGTVGEQIVDGFASLTGSIGGLFNKDFQANIGNFIKEDHVGNFFADQYANGALSDINKYSYFSADSTAANIFKGVGVAAGYIGLAVLTGGAAGAVGGVGAVGGATAALSNVGLNAAIAGIGGLGRGTQAGLQAGKSYNNAFGEGITTAAIQAGTVFVAGKAFEALSKGGTTGSETTPLVNTSDDAISTPALGLSDEATSGSATGAGADTPALGLSDEAASGSAAAEGADTASSGTTTVENATKTINPASDASSSADGLQYGRTITKGDQKYIYFKDADGNSDIINVSRVGENETLNGSNLTEDQINYLMDKAGLSHTTANPTVATNVKASAPVSPSSTVTSTATNVKSGISVPSSPTVTTGGGGLPLDGVTNSASPTVAISAGSTGSPNMGILLADSAIGGTMGQSNSVFKSDDTVKTTVTNADYSKPTIAENVPEMSGFKSNIYPLSSEEQNAYINSADASQLFKNYKSEGYSDSDAQKLADDELAINNLEKSRVNGVVESAADHDKYIQAQEQFQSDLKKAKENSTTSNNTKPNTEGNTSSTGKTAFTPSNSSSGSATATSGADKSVTQARVRSEQQPTSTETTTNNTTNVSQNNTTSTPTITPIKSNVNGTSTSTTTNAENLNNVKNTTATPTSITPVSNQSSSINKVSSTNTSTGTVANNNTTTATPTITPLKTTTYTNRNVTPKTTYSQAKAVNATATSSAVTSTPTMTTTSKVSPTIISNSGQELDIVGSGISSSVSNIGKDIVTTKITGNNAIPIGMGFAATGVAAVAGTHYIKKKDEEDEISLTGNEYENKDNTFSYLGEYNENSYKASSKEELLNNDTEIKENPVEIPKYKANNVNDIKGT